MVAQLRIIQCKLLLNYRNVFYRNFCKNIYLNRIEDFSVTVSVLVKYKG